MHKTLDYRTDIDGLRAIAVVAVVLHHAGASWLPGGFVGVDVFFVISGYLITRILLREMETGQFSIIGFYERRARRILPALFVVIAACLVTGWFILPPNAFEGLAHAALATLFFASNIWFWRTSGDYFAQGVEFEPLLHSWSLAVEEQFYLFFPLLLWGLARHPRRLWILVVGMACLASFVLSVWATGAEPVANFYLAPTRAWELGLGALLAMGAAPRLQHHATITAVATMGLLLILGSMALTTKSTPFPGPGALAPCLGATCVIWAGIYGRSPVFRLLSLRPMVWLGLISYGLYLWHWPLLVGARLMNLDGDLSTATTIACLLSAVVLASLSLHLIERPFRARSGHPALSRRSILAQAAGGTAALAALSLVITVQNGFPQRIPETALIRAQASQERHSLDVICTGLSVSDAPCLLGATPHDSTAVNVVIWGDSHAAALLPGLDEWLTAQAATARAFVSPACPPLLGVDVAFPSVDSHENCSQRNDAVVRFVEDTPGIDTVILTARWPLATEGHRTPGEYGTPMILSAAGTVSVDVSRNAGIMRAGLERTVARLSATGAAIVVIGSVPEIGFHPPEALLRHAGFNMALPAGPSRVAFERRNGRAQKILQDISDRYDAVLISPAQHLCTTGCRFLEGDKILYRDDDHLSIYGAHWLVRQMSGSLPPPHHATQAGAETFEQSRLSRPQHPGPAESDRSPRTVGNSAPWETGRGFLPTDPG